MKLYEFKNEEKIVILVVQADANCKKIIEEHFNKSVEDINKELSKNNYFMWNNHKITLSTMFLDFINE